jgi:acetylcholinesterase
VSFLSLRTPHYQSLTASHTQYSWGQSAGALSITAHLVTNSANSPFRAAILVCLYNPKTRFGTANNPILAFDYDPLHDRWSEIPGHVRPPVQFTGCTSAPDILKCLRVAPYATLREAIDTTPSLVSPNGVDYTWSITIVGDLIEKSPRQYIRGGRCARVPILGGQVDDEGT